MVPGPLAVGCEDIARTPPHPALTPTRRSGPAVAGRPRVPDALGRSAPEPSFQRPPAAPLRAATHRATRRRVQGPWVRPELTPPGRPAPRGRAITSSNFRARSRSVGVSEYSPRIRGVSRTPTGDAAPSHVGVLEARVVTPLRRGDPAESPTASAAKPACRPTRPLGYNTRLATRPPRAGDRAPSPYPGLVTTADPDRRLVQPTRQGTGPTLWSEPTPPHGRPQPAP
jgi:hypothetical protein